MDKFTKITIGFVCQTYKKNAEGIFVCTRQEFIAGDQCDCEDMEGNPLESIPEHAYQPYDMVAPEAEKQGIRYLLYNEVLGSLESEDPIEAESLEDAMSQVLRNMGYSIIEAEKHKDE